LVVVTVMVASTSPDWVSDHLISVASNITGAKPPSRKAEANLSSVAASEGATFCTSDSLSAPGMPESASRYITSVRAPGVGSGPESAGAAVTVGGGIIDVEIERDGS